MKQSATETRKPRQGEIPKKLKQTRTTTQTKKMEATETRKPRQKKELKKLKLGTQTTTRKTAMGEPENPPKIQA